MKLDFSRRNFFLRGGALLAMRTLLPRASQASAQVDSLTQSDRAISEISGSDSTFLSAVEALYPGLSTHPEFEKIAPLSILITHEKGPAVRALSVSWKVKTPKSTYETAMFSYVSPGSGLKGHSVTTLISARRAVLRLGQSRLITPFFSWTPAEYKSKANLNWNTVLTSAEPGRFLVSELPAASEVKVALDGAVFSDWKIIGPDHFNLTRRLRSRRNAEHDEGLAVYRLLKSGASDGVVRETLEAHAAAERFSASTNPTRWYKQARTFEAKVLLRAFKEAPGDSFLKALNRLRKTKNTFITRAS